MNESNDVHSANDGGTLVFDELTRQVRAFAEAWGAEGQPPAIADYLPAGPPSLRRLTLIELAKIDLAERSRRQENVVVEEYSSRFTEVDPCDPAWAELVVEEFRLRKSAGETIRIDEYFTRFPWHADALRQLLGVEQQNVSPDIGAPAAPAAVEPGQQLDDFDLLIQLGQGAFAKVFLARQRSMQRLVALKVSADSGTEPQTLAQMEHPHIVRVYDQRTLADRRLRLLYMQYVPGGTLQSVIDLVRETPPTSRSGSILAKAVDAQLEARGEGRLDGRLRERLARRPWAEIVCSIGARLASALDYAHRNGVLHRDVKPANVLIGADGNPRLADFNISFSARVEGATPAAYFGGSLAYMSPEQLEACDPTHPRRADELDGRSDIYALGVLLWELWTGERPFPDVDVDSDWTAALKQMIADRRAGVPQAALHRLPPGPPGLRETLLRCLSPNVEDRPETAGQLARQLELCLRPDVQDAIRPPQRGWRQWAQSWPLAALVAAGMAPNLVTSTLSISYNKAQIIEKVNHPAVSDAFFRALVIVNPVAYLSATIFLLWLAMPVLRAVTRPDSLDDEALQARRRRATWIGDWVAWVTAIEWTFSGLVFPALLHFSASGVLTGDHWAHFIGSQFLLGLIAATFAFFIVTLLCIRAFMPRLMPQTREMEDARSQAALRALARRSWWYLGATAAITPASLLTMVFIRSSDPSAFAALGVLGLVIPILAFTLMRAIQRSTSALATAMSPLGMEQDVA